MLAYIKVCVDRRQYEKTHSRRLWKKSWSKWVSAPKSLFCLFIVGLRRLIIRASRIERSSFSRRLANTDTFFNISDPVILRLCVCSKCFLIALKKTQLHHKFNEIYIYIYIYISRSYAIYNKGSLELHYILVLYILRKLKTSL